MKVLAWLLSALVTGLIGVLIGLVSWHFLIFHRSSQSRVEIGWITYCVFMTWVAAGMASTHDYEPWDR